MILGIETSTEVCSVALIGDDGACLAVRESSAETGVGDHARLLAIYIDELLRGAGLQSTDLSAVAVAGGPGSYTGLRIGVSTAKGLCYGLGIPLIAVGALDSLVELAMECVVAKPAAPAASLRGALKGDEAIRHVAPLDCFAPGGARNDAAPQRVSPPQPTTHSLFCPMIDARRMEVYAQIFDHNGTPLTDVGAHVIDESSFSQWRGAKPAAPAASLRGALNGDEAIQHVAPLDCFAPDGTRNDAASRRFYIFGTGAAKVADTLPWAHYLEVTPSARGLARLAADALAQKRFVDVAYYEPLYLKDFVATTPKKSGVRKDTPNS